MSELIEQIMRSNRRINESQMTKDEVLAMYASRDGLPARRWRIEGGIGGNSRLLSDEAPDGESSPIEKAKAKYGGKVVEVFTATDWWTAKAKGLRACDRCKAEAGAPCTAMQPTWTGSQRTKKTIVVRPHAVRYEEPIDDDVMDVFAAHAGEALKAKQIAAQGVGKAAKVSAAIGRLAKVGKVRKAKGGWMLAVAPTVEAAA